MRIKRISDSFSRPANTTAYAAGDLVANDATAGNVTPLKFQVGDKGGLLAGVRLEKSDTGVTNADFSVHLFAVEPTVANGDNGAFSVDVADKLADIDLDTMVAGTDDAYALLNAGATALPISLALPGTVVYGLIEADGAYTPASSETFLVELLLVSE